MAREITLVQTEALVINRGQWEWSSLGCEDVQPSGHRYLRASEHSTLAQIRLSSEFDVVIQLQWSLVHTVHIIDTVFDIFITWHTTTHLRTLLGAHTWSLSKDFEPSFLYTVLWNTKIVHYPKYEDTEKSKFKFIENSLWKLPLDTDLLKKELSETSVFVITRVSWKRVVKFAFISTSTVHLWCGKTLLSNCLSSSSHGRLIRLVDCCQILSKCQMLIFRESVFFVFCFCSCLKTYTFRLT